MAQKKNDMTQLILTLSMLMTEGITLSDEQVREIRRILLGALEPTLQINSSTSHGEEDRDELVFGIAGLASFMGVSPPTAQKLKNEGRFDEAQINFGGRKLAWRKSKLIEIASRK